NLIAVGATPLAMTDCLNYGSPEKKEIYQQLIDSTKGMSEACEVLQTPVVSGNVSLYNETRGTSIFPTPVVGMVGLIEDVSYLKEFKPKAGDKIYLVGETRDDFGGSQLEKLLYGSVNHEFESIDLGDEISKGKSIKQAIRNGIASHVQTVGKGGLLVTLAKISAHYDLGMQAQLDVTNAQLFSETQGRYIVIVKEGQTLDIDQAQEIGQLTHQQSFDISNSDVKIKENVSDIKQKWEGAIVQCLTTQD
ncbi:MAG: AIR synthase related protein, partial [Staphylococcus epidermidis]|nr:AIR synthase related protein [Staphylococcus epidermidis]